MLEIKARFDYIREYLEARRAEEISNGFYDSELPYIIEACDLSIPFEEDL